MLKIRSQKESRSKIGLCLFKYFPHGGLQKDFLRIANLLTEQYEVEVFTTYWQGDIPSRLAVNIFSVTGLSNHRKMQNFGAKVAKIAKQKNCKLLVSFNKIPEIDIYFAADNCYKLQSVHKHNFFYRLTSRYRIYSALEKSVFLPSSNTKIIALTKKQKHDYQMAYSTPCERFHVLPPDFSAIDFQHGQNDLRASYGIKSDEHLILMVCSAFKTKGVDRALNAMQYIPPTLAEKIHLFVIGKDNPKAYVKQAKKLNLKINIKFLGARDDVLLHMTAADLFLHPARQEAAGKVLLEAMSCGLPVLTVKNCGYAEYIINADSGIVLSESFEGNALAKAVIFMLTSSQKSVWKKNAINYTSHLTSVDLAKDAANFIKSRAC